MHLCVCRRPSILGGVSYISSDTGFWLVSNCSPEDQLVLLQNGAGSNNVPNRDTVNSLFSSCSCPQLKSGVLGPGYLLLISSLWRCVRRGISSYYMQSFSLHYVAAYLHHSLYLVFWVTPGFSGANRFASCALCNQFLLHLFSVSQSFLSCQMEIIAYRVVGIKWSCACYMHNTGCGL